MCIDEWKTRNKISIILYNKLFQIIKKFNELSIDNIKIELKNWLNINRDKEKIVSNA